MTDLSTEDWGWLLGVFGCESFLLVLIAVCTRWPHGDQANSISERVACFSFWSHSSASALRGTKFPTDVRLDSLFLVSFDTFSPFKFRADGSQEGRLHGISVIQCHSMTWLHKCITSSKMFIFAKVIQQIPFIVCFQYHWRATIFTSTTLITLQLFS